jgi:hypothetical protein
LGKAFEGANKVFRGFRGFIGCPQIAAIGGTQSFLIILPREPRDRFRVGICALFYKIIGLLQAKIDALKVARDFGAVRRRGSAILKKMLLMFGRVAQRIRRNEVTRRGERRAFLLVAARQIDPGQRKYVFRGSICWFGVSQPSSHAFPATRRGRPSRRRRRRTGTTPRRRGLCGESKDGQQHEDGCSNVHGSFNNQGHVPSHRRTRSYQRVFEAGCSISPQWPSAF